MRTAKRIQKLEASIRLQERTLLNLQAIDCIDGGRAADLTRQIICHLHGCLAAARRENARKISPAQRGACRNRGDWI